MSVMRAQEPIRESIQDHSNFNVESDLKAIRENIEALKVDVSHLPSRIVTKVSDNINAQLVASQANASQAPAPSSTGVRPQHASDSCSNLQAIRELCDFTWNVDEDLISCNLCFALARLAPTKLKTRYASERIGFISVSQEMRNLKVAVKKHHDSAIHKWVLEEVALRDAEAYQLHKVGLGV
ncbi:hypothetical protein CYMTET_6244 [Cymbomonas tetramitiformis]|uniref:Uncharacterized protein n=1 Tax=Cymbomonas tetramitiformis TaxID=36881 RepID=A0AAE0LI92_9CHLO|nr:hypothetical protein CYMTET_6244 [Cymbomonas tetramitiformis]